MMITGQNFYVKSLFFYSLFFLPFAVAAEPKAAPSNAGFSFGPGFDSNAAATPKAATNSKAEEGSYQTANQLFQDLADKYGLISCEQKEPVQEEEGGKKKKEDNDSLECESGSDYFYSTLHNRCKKSKKEARKCCKDPDECNSKVLEYGKAALAVSPKIKGFINKHKVFKKYIWKDKGLTEQEKADKACHADHLLAMGAFASDVMLWTLPLLEKTCSDKIKECKKSCDEDVKTFEKNLRHVFNQLIKGADGQGHQIKLTLEKAKKCLFGDPNTSFNEITFQKTSNNDKFSSFPVGPSRFHIFKINDPNFDCHGLFQEQHIATNLRLSSAHPASLNNGEKIKELKKFLSQALFHAKAYHNTMKNKKEVFAFNEKEIIDCSRQSDRVAESKKGMGSMPKWVQAVCKNAVQQIAGGDPIPPRLDQSVETPDSNIGGLTGLQNSRNPSSHPLLSNTDKDDGIDMGINDPGFDSNDKPSLSKNPGGSKSSPGSKEAGGGGGASAPGGGGSGSSSDSGGFAGNYPYHSRTGAFGGGFPAGYNDDSKHPMASSGEGAFGDNRELASSGKDTVEKKTPYDGNENFRETKSDGNIFDMASKNIRYFCSNLKCSL